MLRKETFVGANCPGCVKGFMERSLALPMHSRPGFSDVQYRCLGCSTVINQAEDDRFRDAN
jgi:hypothetical protein